MNWKVFWGAFFLSQLLTLGLIYAIPPPNEPLSFYQREPACKDKQAVYLILRNSAAMTEHHRVWVCGYRR